MEGWVSQGVCFIGRELVPTSAKQTDDALAEAYATLGVESTTSMEEITSVYHAKVRHAYPDHARDLNDKAQREVRMKRLSTAHELIEKAKGKG